MFVCLCKSITDHQINDAIDSGVSSFETMQEKLGVASVCGACTCEVKELMSKKFNTNLNVKAALNNHTTTKHLETI